MKNYQSIEGLRAWLAWWVVIFHVFQVTALPGWVPAKAAKVLMTSATPVYLFVIISGFVITHLLLAKQQSYGPYIVRRLMRIAPVYLFCLVLALATIGMSWFFYVELPATELGSKTAHAATLTAFADAPVAHTLAHLTLMHGLIPDNVWPYFANNTIVGPAWSLSLEWQFYLIAPFLLLFLRKSHVYAVVTLVLMFVVGVVTRRLMLTSFLLPSLLILCLQWFAIGIGSRLVMEVLRKRNVTLSASVLFAVLAIPCVLIKSRELLVWSLWMTFILAEDGRLRPSKVWHRLAQVLATNPAVRTLGRASYSTYLVHLPLFAIVGYVWHAFSPIDSVPELQAMLALSIPVIAIASLAMYRWIEKPGIRLGVAWAKRLESRQPVVADAAVSAKGP